MPRSRYNFVTDGFFAIYGLHHEQITGIETPRLHDVYRCFYYASICVVDGIARFLIDSEEVAASSSCRANVTPGAAGPRIHQSSQS